VTVARPVIGLTTYAEDSRFGVKDTFAAVLPMAYVRAVNASGGRAVLIPCDDPGADVLAALDGLVLPGGSDLDPAIYGAPPHPATTGVRPLRDATELLLVRAALDADLPVLGICRGMQLMCAASGGRLHQHLPDVLGHHGHRPVSGPRYGRHDVRLEPGSGCHAVLGDRITVNSFHHQGVADPGAMTATGWAVDDGLIEVVEEPAKRFAVGVEWHPEETDDLRLFAALVAAARG
jgi:putative glutamine amidotransferase